VAAGGPPKSDRSTWTVATDDWPDPVPVTAAEIEVVAPLDLISGMGCKSLRMRYPDLGETIEVFDRDAQAGFAALVGLSV